MPTADAKAAMLALDSVRVSLSECTWIMSQRIATHIATLRTTTGAAVFPGFAMAGGTWVGGIPALVSGAVNEAGATSPATELIALVHGPSIAVADDNLAEISISTSAVAAGQFAERRSATAYKLVAEQPRGRADRALRQLAAPP
jgi:hypothetical protein